MTAREPNSDEERHWFSSNRWSIKRKKTIFPAPQTQTHAATSSAFLFSFTDKPWQAEIHFVKTDLQSFYSLTLTSRRNAGALQSCPTKRSHNRKTNARKITPAAGPSLFSHKRPQSAIYGTSTDTHTHARRQSIIEDSYSALIYDGSVRMIKLKGNFIKVSEVSRLIKTRPGTNADEDGCP